MPPRPGQLERLFDRLSRRLVESGLNPSRIGTLLYCTVCIRRDKVKVIMKIAQVAPLIERVPPRLYGGTERIVSYLTEQLVRLGHDVTLFASGDS